MWTRKWLARSEESSQYGRLLRELFLEQWFSTRGPGMRRVDGPKPS
ncbi:hypothetical protein E2C01_038831 [Portunus trituberculatus]|uniref:Uncharacterized protein n=1 Tax=Portunus trituberculatus TaxID=210409 RepID=A0A5B7FI06_PORTR|nr:hypothetical protein [Portunus trituberculatus]